MPNIIIYHLRLLLLSIGFPFIISYTSSSNVRFSNIPFGASSKHNVLRSSSYDNNNIQLNGDNSRIFLTQEGNDIIVDNLQIESTSNDNDDNDTTNKLKKMNFKFF